MKIPTVETHRLFLQHFNDNDVEPLYHILAEESVLKYFSNSEHLPFEKTVKIISISCCNGSNMAIPGGRLP